MTVTPVGRRLLRLKVRNAQLASRARMCPGQRDSAGKHSSGKTRKGQVGTRSPGPVGPRGLTRQGHLPVRTLPMVMRRRGDAKAIAALGARDPAVRLPRASRKLRAV